MAEKRTFGVLVHGAGWVSTQHIAAYVANPHTKILAISSRSLESARKRAKEAGLKDVALYNNFQEALRHPGVDIVSICTPQHLHCENVLQAASAGKHLVIEKPVATSLTQLRKMQRAVKEAGVKTVVSFVLRWNPLFETLKELLSAGAFGKPYYIEVDYLSHNGSWWSGWNEGRTKEKGVSASLVAGCHAIDAARYFASEERFGAASAVEVFGVRGGWRKGTGREYNPFKNTWIRSAPPMEYEGLEVALIRFDNGAVAKVSTNFDCIMPYRFPIRIFGDCGTVFDNRIWSHLFPGQRDWIEIPSVLPESSDVRHHPFQAEIDHFVECLIGDRESHCNLEDAAKTHEIIFALLRSYETKRPVALPLEESEF